MRFLEDKENCIGYSLKGLGLPLPQEPEVLVQGDYVWPLERTYLDQHFDQVVSLEEADAVVAMGGKGTFTLDSDRVAHMGIVNSDYLIEHISVLREKPAAVPFEVAFKDFMPGGPLEADEIAFLRLKGKN